MLIQKDRVINGKTFTIFGDSEDKSVFNNILNNSDYENHMVDFYGELLKEDSVCIDAGANIGILSMYMSLFTKGKIYAFEPAPDTFSTLVKNIEVNKLNVIPFREALGKSSGKSILLYNNKSNGGASFEYESKDSEDVKIDIDVITLDEFADRERLTQLNLLKMDVEGFEEYVIEGGKNTIKKFNPDIVTEFCPPIIRQKGLDPEKYFEDLCYLYKYIYFIDRPNMRLVRVYHEMMLEDIMKNGYHNIGDVLATNKEL